MIIQVLKVIEEGGMKINQQILFVWVWVGVGGKWVELILKMKPILINIGVEVFVFFRKEYFKSLFNSFENGKLRMWTKTF